MLANTWGDLRYAARSLSRTPGFAAAAVVTIALGVGVNAGIFVILNGVLFRDLPAADAHELVSIEQSVEGSQVDAGPVRTFTIAEYRTYRDDARTVTGLLAHAVPRETTLGGEAPQRIYGAIVSCNYFTVLGSPPALGRGLGAQDCEPGADPVVVLGHGLWATTFAADPAMLGRPVELEGHQFTVVGIAAEGTYGGSPLLTSYFAPLSADRLLWPGESRFENESVRWLTLIGRRSAGTSLAQVRAELEVIAARIDDLEAGRSTTLAIERASRNTLPFDLRGPAAGAAGVLMGAFGLILLIACANVANLLLARGMARTQEIGIRLSLGASRARVVRQLLTESVLISIAGGLLGSALAVWSFQSLVALVLPTAVHPEWPVPALDLDFSPDFRVLWYALALTFGTGFVFGLAPALQVSKPDLNTVIKQDVGGGGRSGGRLRGTLVGVQVAFCMALMIATGLLLRGLYATYTIDPGFTFRDVAHLSFGTDGGPLFLDREMLAQVAALPGVEAAAYASQTPLGEAISGGEVRLSGESGGRFAEVDAVTPGYFSVLELPIVRGRNFTDAESADAERTAGTRPVIVSETTARNFWGETDPLGRTLLWEDTTLEVIGVAQDARLGGLGEIDSYYLYLPRREGGELLVRSSAGFAATTASSLLAIVRARDPSLVARVLPLEANLAWYRSVSGLVAVLGAALGGLALVLAAVGIYGVVSYSVTRRYRELGIRVALGARARDLMVTVLRRTMRPVVIGAVAGIVAAGALSRILSSALFGVSPADPIGLGGAALLRS
ncbi:MAG TPA: ADOP family duplicated permease, partial [Gammaproteobacteria bacterium]|nr:ADOP family duplicated permease [Gammaproteobacteria bacterium]